MSIDDLNEKKAVKIRKENTMNIKDITTLIQAVSDSQLKSFMYQEGNIKLYFEAERAQAVRCYEGSSESMAEVIKADNEQKNQNIITSPMVGTFYSAPSDGAESYVKAGDIVKQGQVIGIVEAMKLMNEIESPYDGVVSQILVNNKDMVGYGQGLMVIE